MSFLTENFKSSYALLEKNIVLLLHSSYLRRIDPTFHNFVTPDKVLGHT